MTLPRGHLVVLFVLSACGTDAAHGVTIRFEPADLAGEVDTIELALVESCDDQTLGEAPEGALAVLQVTRGESQGRFEQVRPGSIGLYARAWAGECDVIASGCETVLVEPGSAKALTVTLRRALGLGCPEGTACTGGRCVSLDAGLEDGGTDSGCPEGFGDCDDETPGCETPLDTTANCGICGARCEFEHSTAACESRACTLTSCEIGWADCNVGAYDGCETYLLEDLDHCGRCDNSCGWVCDGTDCDDVDHLGAADFHTCATTESGSVYCWGHEIDNVPTLMADLTGPISVSGGNLFTCASLDTGEVQCWGNNERGQLGDGGTTDRTSPAAVRGLTSVERVEAGAKHACALLSDRTLRCWGDNSVGQLGNGIASPDPITTPVLVEDLATVHALSANEFHTCAVRGTGRVYCWGANNGRIGDGFFLPRPEPARVIDLTDAIDVAAGRDHTCALRSAGTVVCWGNNEYGQLGTGQSTSSRVLRPMLAVSRVSGATAIAAGAYHTCALVTGGEVMCWGQNRRGQLGDGTTVNRSQPVSMMGGAFAVAIAAGGGFTCVLRESGGVTCVGYGTEGQLGNGANADSSVPVSVASP